VSLPEGAKSAIEDRDFTIATIAPPTVTRTTEEADAAADAADEVPATDQGVNEPHADGVPPTITTDE
jgi:large subunit ribosomal protein L25